jgi:DNA-binding response OmpR family regulator
LVKLDDYDRAVSRVLLVEDDPDIAEPLARALGREGHEVVTAMQGREALRIALDDAVELLVLDVGLPEMSGMDVCRGVRAVHPTLPILMLTARDGELDAVAGLDAGADVYITKPFRLAELLAQVRAMLRRAAPAESIAGDVRVDPGARRAWRDEAELQLTPKEFDLLAVLVAKAGQVVSREQIMERVWDRNWFGSTKTLDMHVSSLRRKLGDPACITTVRGRGFRFEP